MADDELRILNVHDVHTLHGEIDVVSSMRSALVAIAEERVSAPPRVSAHARDGKLTAMPSYVEGHGLSCKLMAVFPGMAPFSHSGAVGLFDEDAGRMLALVDAGLLTGVRTAAVTALATDALAREDAGVLCVVGSGTQAQAHLRQLRDTRPWRRVIVASRSRRHDDALRASDERVETMDSVEEAVRAADVVVGCTSSPTPLILDDWLRPGTHVSSVGGGHELDPLLVQRSRVVVEWFGAAQHPSPAGAHELQGVDESQLTLLGSILNGSAVGRRSPEEVTVYKATGLGAEDAVVVHELYRRAVDLDVGQRATWPRGHQ
jgi:ornithine cyclodeaminase/alanine dehydrogenase-like protein (mu-crystallin family)